MKESRYVKLAKTMLNVLMKARVPLYMKLDGRVEADELYLKAGMKGGNYE